MKLSDNARKYYEKMFQGGNCSLIDTDPEFAEVFANFAFDEVVNSDDLDDTTRMLAVLAALLGCQGTETFKIMLPAALNLGVTPIQVKETVYQAVAYLGIGRILPFIHIVNETLNNGGIELPLPKQATTNADTRIARGNQAQVDIFGPHMKDFWDFGPKESRHINLWLAGNCFGDYYTRNGMDYKIREMITFCFLAAQGGCEPQLTSHAEANIRIGNDKQFLIKIISQCLPYIGYPRSLNALNCVNRAVEKKKEGEL